MGCFSFLCQVCGRGIRSSSFSGERCHPFLLREGKVVQKMSGEYDSYGRVFIDGTQEENVKHNLRKSVKWVNPLPEPLDPEKVKSIGEDHAVWLRVCDLMHDSGDFSNGMAAFHDHCYSGQIPTTRSEPDPNQGWGDDEGYFFSTQGEGYEYKPQKPIPGYDVLAGLKKRQLQDEIWNLKCRLEGDKITLRSWQALAIEDPEKYKELAKTHSIVYEGRVRELRELQKEYEKL